jgi:hypothetical protein
VRGSDGKRRPGDGVFCPSRDKVSTPSVFSLSVQPAVDKSLPFFYQKRKSRRKQNDWSG